jgi:hypothetical protein
MHRKTAVVTLVTVAIAPGAALAGMNDADLEAAFGTNEAAWVHPVKDSELGGLRGGAGVLFSGFFDSTVDQASSASLPDGFTVTELGPSQVQVSSGFGNFGNFNGVLQLANVRGDFNTVRNVLNVNITINPPQSNLLGFNN